MPSYPSDAAATPGARPYGPFGLVVSTIVIALIAVVVLLLIGGALFGVVVALQGWPDALRRTDAFMNGPSQDVADRVNIAGGAIAYVVTAGSIVLVARFRGGARWIDLVGWRAWDMSRNLKLVAALLAATLTYSLLASSAIERVYPQAKDWTPTPSGTPWIIGFLALATLFAPITEELLFRGWIYTSLREMIGVRFGIVLSALLFALAHWESTHLYALAVFPVGLALGYIRQRTDSVAASITLHSLYNGVAAVLLFVAR